MAGNVRELRNLVERAMIVSSGPTLLLEVPVGVTSASREGASQRLADVEREHIIAVLERVAWRVREPWGRGHRPRAQAHHARGADG